MLKYWYSSFAEIAGGGAGRCVRGRPGNARRTSSGTNASEQTFTSCGTLVISSTSPAVDRIASTQRERPKQR